MDLPHGNCRYARISGDSASGDTFIDIADMSTDKMANLNNNIESHVGGSESDPALFTVTSLESYRSKDSSMPETYGSENSSNISSNASLHRKIKRRFIKKSGHCNVSHAHLQDKPKRFMADIFTTCVDLRWRWNILLFSTAFIVSWLFFGLIYWVVAYAHGDFVELEENRPNRTCVNNLDPTASFTSAFLFSLETQTTIGYGFRVVSEECPVAIITVVVQSIFGCVIDAFMIGLIMAKISRPKKRAETLLFSKKAVINVRDGQMCLMVRVGNLRKSHLVEATIRMQYLYSRHTLEGEFIPLDQIDLHLDLKNDSDRLFLVTPQTICHPIDADSPLYSMSKDSLRNSDFEIIVILEGMVEATGMTTQARASYLPDEILWGRRFENVITFSQTNGYHVNFKKFDSTIETTDALTCSPADLAQHKLMIPIGPNDTVKRRNTNGSTKINLDDSSASDGRDSGYTPIEEEDNSPTNSTKTLDQCQSRRTGSALSSVGGVETRKRSGMKSKQNEKEVERRESEETNNDSVFLTTDFNRRKRKSQEIASQITQEQNVKNAAMNTAETAGPVEDISSKMKSTTTATKMPSVQQTPRIVVEPVQNGNTKSKKVSAATPRPQTFEGKFIAIELDKGATDEKLSLIKNPSPDKIPVVAIQKSIPKGDSPV